MQAVDECLHGFIKFTHANFHQFLSDLMETLRFFFRLIFFCKALRREGENEIIRLRFTASNLNRVVLMQNVNFV